MVITKNSIVSLRSDGHGWDDRPIVGMEQKESAQKEDTSLYCRACGRIITGRDQQILINGSHSHTFFNPAGIVYELGCFREACGCMTVGEATAEFTWFSGHAWRFALCLSCDTHLGWFFEMGEHSFYGLILIALNSK